MHRTEVKAFAGMSRRISMKPMPPTENLHRKNAAEWILWAMLLPAVPVAWLIASVRDRDEPKDGKRHG
jgi:hypothetical protein